jgi:hypothetical protein
VLIAGRQQGGTAVLLSQVLACACWGAEGGGAGRGCG